MSRFADASVFPFAFGTRHKTMGANVALTVASASIVTWQAPRPEQPPLHPVNVDPAAAVAISVTTVPPVNGAEHVEPQLSPAGTLVAAPEPEPN
jgi:hypothetical protein